jgi:hypothetical protein
MTTKIFKYQLKLKDEQTVAMPGPARILSVQMQNDKVQMWAVVTPGAPLMEVPVKIVETGKPIDDLDGWTFIGTVQMYRLETPEPAVWHVFVKGVS